MRLRRLVTLVLPGCRQVKLRLRSQVMLLANIEPGVSLVNGSRGVVVGFTSQAHWQAENQQLLHQARFARMSCCIPSSFQPDPDIWKRTSVGAEVKELRAG